MIKNIGLEVVQDYEYYLDLFWVFNVKVLFVVNNKLNIL